MIANSQLPFKDKYPNFKVRIECLSITDIPENGPLAFLKQTHDWVKINEGSLELATFKGVMHKCLSGLLKCPGSYRVWFNRPDKFDRYLEILNVEKIASIFKLSD